MLTQNLKNSKLQYVIVVYKNFGDSAPTETSCIADFLSVFAKK
jgi:hypothetical protein